MSEQNHSNVYALLRDRKLVHSWLHPACEKRQANCGHGIFTNTKIAVGTTILIQGGHVMSLYEDAHLPPEIWDLPMQISDEFMIGPRELHEVEDADFVNHSCDPNAGWKGHIFLVAMRDIAANEEIRFDYATVVSLPGYKFDCECGSPHCRKRVTSEDWKDSEIQRRYDGWFQYYLQQKIHDLTQQIDPNKSGKYSRPHVPIAIRDAGEKGWGVFAECRIDHGSHVFTLTGERVDYETVTQLVKSGQLRNDDPLHIGEGIFLILDSLSDIFNHSCDPNLGVRGEGELFTLRDILPGEVLCFDYSTTVPPGWTSADWSMECRCGSAICRGILGDVLTLPAEMLNFYQQTGALTDHVINYLPPPKSGF